MCECDFICDYDCEYCLERNCPKSEGGWESEMQIDLFKLIDSITGHTDISASESYDNESFNNMETKIYIINGLISDLEENLLHKGHNGFYSVEKLKKQARDNLKEIRDFCQEILDEEESYDK